MESAAPRTSHHLDVSATAQTFKTDLNCGLSQSEAATRLARFGPNELIGKPPPAWWKKLLGQFTDLVIWILLVAAALSALLGDWLEAAAILAIVGLNALLGFVQEQRAE